MRRKCEFISKRNEDLHRAYKEVVNSGEYNNIIDCIRVSLTLPASKFWVSSENAARIISRIEKGDTLYNISPLRKEMFMELYKRFLEEKLKHPESKSIYKICEIIIEQPAPRFYIGLQRGIKIIKQERNRRCKMMLDKLSK